MPEQSDPVTDRLARFTPNAAGFDRDALLFAAGQRSARGSRFWPAVAALLAVLQIVTLIALWPNVPAALPVISPTVAPNVPPGSAAPATPPAPDVWTVRSDPDATQIQSPTPGEFIAAGPPLTAGSAFRFD